MIRAPFLALALGVLAGCNPLMYVPTPIPAAPRATGVEMQGDLGLSFLSGQVRATGSPADGLGLYASGFTAGGLSESNDWGHSGRGGEVGVLGLGRFGELGFVEGGLGLGSASVRAQDYNLSSDRRDDIQANVLRSSIHVGLGVERDLEPGYARTEYVSVGFLVRGTNVNIRNVRAVGGGSAGFVDESQRYIEPAFRFRYDGDAFAIEAQTGLSIPVDQVDERQFDAYPFFGGVGLSFRLDRLFSSRPPSRPAIPVAQ